MFDGLSMRDDGHEKVRIIDVSPVMLYITYCERESQYDKECLNRLFNLIVHVVRVVDVVDGEHGEHVEEKERKKEIYLDAEETWCSLFQITIVNLR